MHTCHYTFTQLFLVLKLPNVDILELSTSVLLVLILIVLSHLHAHSRLTSLPSSVDEAI
jgi:hypothetical protein